MAFKILELLMALEAEFPPPINAHHAMHAAKYGNDQEGWRDQLALTLNLNGVFRTLFMEEDDIERPLDEVLLDIRGIISA